MKLPFFAAISAVSLMLTACASVTAPTTVTTVVEAEQATTLVMQGADVYVKSAYPDAAHLAQVKALAGAVQSALIRLESANSAGQSAAMAAFNAALSAFNAYETSATSAAAVAAPANVTAASGN